MNLIFRIVTQANDIILKSHITKTNLSVFYLQVFALTYFSFNLFYSI